MNPKLTNEPASDEIDRLLATHFAANGDITPSSGFAHSVMDAVRSETTAPQPIPFPWRRVLPGLVAVAVALIGFGIFALRQLRTSSGRATEPQRYLLHSLPPIQQWHVTSVEQALLWVAASAVLALAVAAVTMRVAGTRSTMRM